MMEVKQSATSMDFNDLISASTNSNSNSEDTAVLSTDLEASKLKADLLDSNEISTNGLLPEVTNGSSNNFNDAETAAETASIDLDGDIDLDGSLVTPELEDELLADDNDTNVVDQLITKTADSLTDDKAEASSSTANSSDKQHNPGDDLDMLLSKINDIVEDCIDTVENVEEKTETQTEKTQNKVITAEKEEKKEEVNVDDSAAPVEEKAEEQLSEKIEEVKAAQTNVQSVEENDVEMKSEAEPMEKDEETEIVDKQLTASQDVFMDCDGETFISESDQYILDVDIDAAQNKHDARENEKLDKASKDLKNKDLENAADVVETKPLKEVDEIANKETEVVTEKEKKIEEAEELSSFDTNESKEVEKDVEVQDGTEGTSAKVAEVAEVAEVKNSIEEKSTEEVDKEMSTPIQDDDEEMPEETKPADTSNDIKEEVLDSAKKVSITEPNTDVKVESPEVDDSDDDVVFFVDKPDAEKIDESEVDIEKSEESKPEQSKESTAKTEEIKPATSMTQNEDDGNDDVVLLDDDDEDEADTATDQKPQSGDKAEVSDKTKSDDKTPQTEEASEDSVQLTNEKKSTVMATEEKTDTTKATAEAKSGIAVDSKNDSDLLADNSDNARDDFAEIATTEKEKDNAEKTADTGEAEETNSNCSSSSNLLQEAKTADSVGPEEEEEETAVEEPELENEEEDEAEAEDGDVELVEEQVATPLAVMSGDETKDGDEAKELEEKETAPPVKRIRLSDKNEESKMTVVDDECSKNSITDEKEDNIDIVEIPAEDKSKEETNEASIVVATAAVKRSHDVLENKDELLTEAVEETATKKAKTEETDKEAVEEIKKLISEVPKVKQNETDVNEAAVVAADEKKDIEPISEAVEESTESKTEAPPITETIPEEKPTEERKYELRAVPSDIPIPLYPAPKFDTFTKSLSLDFYHRFRKSFVKLTKNDLEELALQKVVEAIVHKSEFAEMREIIEKQEKIIALHRTRISELSKQFRDLEMVHNRVLKDVEQKNSQFIMPVKITRAVGLQVFIPHKKISEPLANAVSNTAAPPAIAVANSATSTTVASQASQLPPTVRSSPQRLNTSLTSPQRPSAIGTADAASSANAGDVIGRRISNSALASAAASAALNTRRGCAQKITPQRPTMDAVATTSSNAVSSSTTLPAATSSLHSQLPVSLISQLPTHQQQSQSSGSNVQKSLNKTIALNNAAAAIQRNRFPGPTPAQKLHQAQVQQQQQAQQQQQQLARQQMQNLKFRKLPQKPPTGITQQQQQQQLLRRSDPMPQATILPAVSSSMDSYMNSLNQLTPGVPAVSITPAKPKEKAVIDLTDEDDASHAPPPPPLHTRGGGVPVPGNQSAAAAAASAYMNNRAAAAAAVGGRMPNNQKPQMAVRQLSSMQAPKSNGNTPLSSISTPPGTSITRVHISGSGGAANSAQRTKYGHPAPLPPAPPQTFNPAWKLPPPRPTIRISNLDNGIVISWTMEESMERHADCVSYQIYAYQETSGPPVVDSWRHVGDVKAMLLPMAVTLTQFQEGQRYYFAVRAVDVHQRFGQFSVPKTWS